MTDILAIPAEFDTILFEVRVKKFLLPRPPLGPFTHYAVRTFARTCSEGRIGLNWRDHLLCAQETWNSLSAEENSIYLQAAKRDKQRYEDCVVEPAAAAALRNLDEHHQQATGFAPSAFELFKTSPATRTRLFDAKQGPVSAHETYYDHAFLRLWGRIDEEEKFQWREEAKRRLDVRNADRISKGEECIALNVEPPAPEDPSPHKRTRKSLGAKYHESQEIVVTEEESKAQKADINPTVESQWKCTEDHNLTADEKHTLESIPPNLRRWDRRPRAARSAYTLYYTDRVTAAGSPHSGRNPHSPSTRAAIHADWQAATDETRLHFQTLARHDEAEHERQSNEYNEWQQAWWDAKPRLLLRKVIDRWRRTTSFDDGQNRARDIPRPAAGCGSDGDYGLPSLHYPVIRTDYSDDAGYQHLRHILLNSGVHGDATEMAMTYYDGLMPASLGEGETDLPSCAEEDRRSNDYAWCKAHFENLSPTDLLAAFGELSFYNKEHIPIYSFGGHSYAIIVDGQSIKDGTVVFRSMSRYDFVDSRPDGVHREDGAWEEDETKRWYLSPRVQAADAVCQLLNLDISNMSWGECVRHRVVSGLDLRSDHEAQRWRGWQWAIEYIFGAHALDNVVGVLEEIPYEAYFEKEDEH